MEAVGFLIYTADSHQGAIKNDLTSLLKSSHVVHLSIVSLQKYRGDNLHLRVICSAASDN